MRDVGEDRSVGGTARQPRQRLAARLPGQARARSRPAGRDAGHGGGAQRGIGHAGRSGIPGEVRLEILASFKDIFARKEVETDLGEYIVQLRGEHPAHIITPAVHLRAVDVGHTFEEKLNLPFTEDVPVGAKLK